jgi:hypothetical protein
MTIGAIGVCARRVDGLSQRRTGEQERRQRDERNRRRLVHGAFLF